MPPRVLAAIGWLLLAAGPAVASQPGEPPRPPLIAVESPAEPVRVPQLIEQLRTGRDLLLLIRHERTEVPSVEDDYTRPASDCTTQRNLSPAGFAGALETRVALRALAIPVARVIASPMCRATETARQLFVSYETDPRLMHEAPDQGRTNDVAARDLLAAIEAVRATEGNVALVTHFGLIFRATGLSLSEGEIAILRREANGRLTLLRQIMGSDLGPFAREALGPVRP